MAIPQYDDKAYDLAVSGPFPYVLSSTYDWYNQLINPASQREILDVYWDWNKKFRFYKSRDSVWFSKGPPYPPAMLPYLRKEQLYFENSSPSPQGHPTANQSSAQEAR